MKHTITIHTDPCEIHGFKIGATDIHVDNEFNSDEAETVGNEIRMIADNVAQKFVWLRIIAEKMANVELRRKELNLERDAANWELQKARRELDDVRRETDSTLSKLDEIKWQKRKIELELEQKKSELGGEGEPEI